MGNKFRRRRNNVNETSNSEGSESNTGNELPPTYEDVLREDGKIQDNQKKKQKIQQFISRKRRK